MTQLLCPIAKSALQYPNNKAIETESLPISYIELETMVQCTQSYIRSLTLLSKKVGIIATHSIDTILLYFAALRLGYSVCLLNPKDPKNALEEKIRSLELSPLTLSHKINAASFPQNTLIQKQHLSTYLYTSGSSALPKIACLSFKNHYYSALGMLQLLELTSKDRYLLSLPLYHVSGLAILFRTFLSGATLVIGQHQDIDPLYLLQHKISHLSLVFTQYVRLLKKYQPELTLCLKSVLLGGSFFSQNLLEEGIDKKLPLYLSYGLTEMGSTVCCNPLMKTKNYINSGLLLPYRSLHIDPQGEVLVGGDTLFQGYYSPLTHNVLTHTGWFHTKDLGSYSPQEGLILQGRSDRLIISGGENIQPEEIEHNLLSIPGVHQAVIFAVPDVEFGQKIIAVVDLNPSLSFAYLSEMLTQSLPRYKLPKHYLLWPTHLKTTSLKISAALRKELYQHILSHQCL